MPADEAPASGPTVSTHVPPWSLSASDVVKSIDCGCPAQVLAQQDVDEFELDVIGALSLCNIEP